MKQKVLTILCASAFLAWPVYGAIAADDGHDHHNEKSQEGEHDDDDHGHAEQGGHEDHDDHGHAGHDEHEEGQTQIAPEHAEKAGIKIATARAGSIAKEVVLNGRITLNSDTTANVRARFPAIVRDVSVRMGQAVEKGDVLARLESNESLRDYTITAPVSGVILERNTNIGDVANDETLFVIADLSTVWAKFHIFPKDADLIREGQKVRVHTVDHDKEAISTIKLFLPTADALSQTHVVIVELNNAEGGWRPGLTVDGHVAVSEDQALVVIPESALQTMEDQKVVFVKSGQTYEMRPVKIGVSDGKTVEILSGLNAGEQYVSKGSFIIKADIMKSGAAHEH